MLRSLVDIVYLKSLLGYTYESECSVLNYLISLFKTTESYFRSIALGLTTFEFTTSPEVYSLLGLEKLEYSENLDLVKLYGNTDILINFPHMMDEYRVDELVSLNHSPRLYVKYEAIIDSLGTLDLSVLKHNYHLSTDGFGPLNLSYGLDLEYLYELSINHVFSDGVLLDFYKMNQHIISMKYYLYNYDVLCKLLNSLNDLLYNPNLSLNDILKTPSLNPFMSKELSLSIDIYSDLSSFYMSDIESFVLLKSYFSNIILTLDLSYINNKTPIIKWLSELKSEDINIILKGDSVGLLDFLDLMLISDK